MNYLYLFILIVCVCVCSHTEGACSPVCEGCHQPIGERFLLRVHDTLWHERCVKCSTCAEPLKSTCFLRDSKIYCRQDYQRETHQRGNCKLGTAYGHIATVCHPPIDPSKTYPCIFSLTHPFSPPNMRTQARLEDKMTQTEPAESTSEE
ncbi:LIM homeobox transcription factor 1-alpha [Tachysurus ichikawai]